MKWICIRNNEGKFFEDKIPTDKNTYIFICWHDKWKTVVVNYVGNMESVKANRGFHLENYYTHFCLFKPPVL